MIEVPRLKDDIGDGSIGGVGGGGGWVRGTTFAPLNLDQ